MFIKKRIIQGMIISIALSVPLYATSVRDMGMGLYENPWFIDGLQSYVYQNPAYLSNYNDITFFERIGALDGQNMGAIFYSLSPDMHIGIHIGRPVDSNIWASTDTESLYHSGNYEIHGAPVGGGYLPTGYLQYDGYQLAMVDGKVIDLMDPTEGSRYETATTTSKSDNVNELLQRNVSLMASYKTGNLAMGLDLGYATSWSNKRNNILSTTTENDEYKFINTEYDVTFGCLYNIDNRQSVDGAVGWTMYSINSTYEKMVTGGYTASMSYKTDMAMDISGLVRYNMQLAKNHRMHLRAAYTYINHSTKGEMQIDAIDTVTYDTVGGEDTFSRTGQNIKVGISDEISFNSIKAFAGFDIQYKMFKNEYSGKDEDVIANSADKYTNELNTITIPIIIGMETTHDENWKTRYGIMQRIYQPVTNTGENITGMGSETNPNDYNGNSSSATDLFAGISYKRGNFSFDWLVNMNLFVAGPYFVSGKTATGTSVPTAFSTAIAATYSFDSLVSGNNSDPEVNAAENVVKPAEEKTKTVKPVDLKAKTVKPAVVKPVTKP